MFTGMIRELGVLRQRRGGLRALRLDIAAPATAPQLGVGDSLAVNGICLTVVQVQGPVVTVDAAVETLRATTLPSWRVGRLLHLEPALRVGEALDGHLVLGHVDGRGRIVACRRAGAGLLMTVHCGPELARWLLPKGSVAVDGVSLTVDAGPHRDRFMVNLVPHTLRATDLARARPGRAVNLEMDVLVKAARGGRFAQMLAAATNGAAAHRPDTAPPWTQPAPRAAIRSVADIRALGFHRKGQR